MGREGRRKSGVTRGTIMKEKSVEQGKYSCRKRGKEREKKREGPEMGMNMEWSPSTYQPIQSA